jgi:predicted HicB family RNase H-like nuclease
MNEDGKEIMCVLIDSKLKDYLNNEAKKRGISLSKLVREIIIDYIIESGTGGGTGSKF